MDVETPVSPSAAQCAPIAPAVKTSLQMDLEAVDERLRLFKEKIAVIDEVKKISDNPSMLPNSSLMTANSCNNESGSGHNLAGPRKSFLQTFPSAENTPRRPSVQLTPVSAPAASFVRAASNRLAASVHSVMSVNSVRSRDRDRSVIRDRSTLSRISNTDSMQMTSAPSEVSPRSEMRSSIHRGSLRNGGAPVDRSSLRLPVVNLDRASIRQGGDHFVVELSTFRESIHETSGRSSIRIPPEGNIRNSFSTGSIDVSSAMLSAKQLFSSEEKL